MLSFYISHWEISGQFLKIIHSQIKSLIFKLEKFILISEVTALSSMIELKYFDNYICYGRNDNKKIPPEDIIAKNYFCGETSCYETR